MTFEDAVKVCSIVQYVDGGCSVCIKGTMEDLVKQFPEVDWSSAYAARVPDSDEWRGSGGEWEQRDE